MDKILSAVVASLFEDIEVIKRTGSYVDGRWIIVENTESGKAAVQPAPSEKLENLAEGAQRIGAKMFWLTEKLKIVDEKTGQISDKIIYKNRQYKLTDDSDWEEEGYFKYLGTLSNK